MNSNFRLLEGCCAVCATGLEVTSTSYNTAGQVATVTDPKGTTTYTYDGDDAKGKLERRGMVTKLNVSRGNGQGDLTYTGAYDADGLLVKQGMPGKLATVYTYDPAGQLTDLTYTGQVTPVTEETDPDTGETTWIPGEPVQNQPWLAWSRRYDITGRVSAEWNGAGAGFEGIPGVSDPADIEAPTIGHGLAADKRYIYDYAGRLTRAEDRTAADTGITLDPDTGGDPQAPCVRREYQFDKNGNRTKLKTSSSDGGNCFYATLDSEIDYTYDALDRPLKAADGTDYVYDSFGRQTLIPEVDAPVNDAGDISVTYFDDDLAKTITQDGITTTFELDALARRTTSTITGNPTVTRHYGDDTDNPAWTTNSDGMVMRSAGSLDGLGAIIFGDGAAALTIGNPHGDNVTTVILPVGHDEDTPAVSINEWADYDEYGVSKTGQPQGVTYGWLGKHERSASIESAGLTLMGVRLYNPIRGAFTSTDPVAGGNSNAYTYPQDPINMMDLSGLATKWLFDKSFKPSEALRWALRLKSSKRVTDVIFDGIGKVKVPNWGTVVKIIGEFAMAYAGQIANHVEAAVKAKPPPGYRLSRVRVRIGIKNWGGAVWRWRVTFQVFPKYVPHNPKKKKKKK